jgi:hypothetical protein
MEWVLILESPSVATMMNRRRRLFEISAFWNLGIPFFWNYKKRSLSTFQMNNRLKAVILVAAAVVGCLEI